MLNRKVGKKLLTTLKNKKVENFIENYLYHHLDDNNKYLEYIYNICGVFMKTGDLELVIDDITNKKFNFDSNFFEKYKNDLEEQDSFIQNPLSIEEGVLTCGRCNSKKTISFQKQIRSADEGSTTFAQCVECNLKWTHNN